MLQGAKNFSKIHMDFVLRDKRLIFMTSLSHHEYTSLVKGRKHNAILYQPQPTSNITSSHIFLLGIKSSGFWLVSDQAVLTGLSPTLHFIVGKHFHLNYLMCESRNVLFPSGHCSLPSTIIFNQFISTMVKS